MSFRWPILSYLKGKNGPLPVGGTILWDSSLCAFHGLVAVSVLEALNVRKQNHGQIKNPLISTGQHRSRILQMGRSWSIHRSNNCQQFLQLEMHRMSRIRHPATALFATEPGISSDSKGNLTACIKKTPRGAHANLYIKRN